MNKGRRRMSVKHKQSRPNTENQGHVDSHMSLNTLHLTF